MSHLRFTLAFVACLFSVCSIYAQKTNKRINISFNSCVDVDSNIVEAISKRNDFRFKDLGDNNFSFKCTDMIFAPDSSSLNAYFKQSVDNADSLNNDTTQVLHAGHLKFPNNFYGIFFQFKTTKKEKEYYHVKLVAYSYNECFGDMIFNHYSEDSISYKSDSARMHSLISRLKIYTSDEVRTENQKIRDLYKLQIDSLAYDNWWIYITRVNGMMVRDTLHMADIDTVLYKPRFTHYNITYRGKLTINPRLKHQVKEFNLEGLKDLKIDEDGNYIFEIRDRTAGMVNKKGTLVVLNSIGYPLDLNFYFSYFNTVLDILYKQD